MVIYPNLHIFDMKLDFDIEFSGYTTFIRSCDGKFYVIRNELDLRLAKHNFTHTSGILWIYYFYGKKVYVIRYELDLRFAKHNSSQYSGYRNINHLDCAHD